MANHPYDYPPKSKIPVPESPYLTHTGFLSDLSDSVFFDENIPTPLDPIPKTLDKPPPYSYGPPGLLNERNAVPTSRVGPSTSPSLAKKTHRLTNQPEGLTRTTSSDLVEKKLEELLGPSDVHDNVDDLLLHTKSLEDLHSDSSARATPFPPYQQGPGRMERKKSNSTPKISDATAAGFYVPGASDPDVIQLRVPHRGRGALASGGRVVGRGEGLQRQSTSSGGSGGRSASGGRSPSGARSPSGGRIASGRGGGQSGSAAGDSAPTNIARTNSPSKRGGASPAKGSPSKNAKLKPKPDTKPGGSGGVSGGGGGGGVAGGGVGGGGGGVVGGGVGISGRVTPQAGGTAGSNVDPKNVSKTLAKKVDAPARKAAAATLAANDPAKGVKGNVGSSRLKITENPVKAGLRDGKESPKKNLTKTSPKKSPVGNREAGAAGKSVMGGAAAGAAAAGTAAAAGAAGAANKNLPQKTPIKGQQPALAGTAIPGHDTANANEQKNEKLAMDNINGQRLLTMCQKGDWNGVESLLRAFEKAISLGEAENVNPLAGVSDQVTGWTPLMYAVKDNRIPVADRMIDLGSDVNFRNKESLTALHVASLYARDETIRFLVFKKADVTLLTDPKKQNALHLACARPSGNSTSILKALLSVAPKESRLQKDKEGNIPLFVALNSGSRGACQELLGSLAHEQMRIHAGPYKDTALHMAVRKRDLEIARIFVDSSANVDSRNGEHQTPLHIASAQGDESLVKFFYLCKANPNMADKEDRTPIHLAAQYGHTQIIDLLADKFKVSVFERTRDGSTLMHIASLHGHPETAMALFRKGVPLQMPNKGGARSLHIAARYGHAQMISKLLEKGEKVDAVTNDNYTALHIGVESGRPNVVETLLGYGAQVHIKGGKSQETPLHIAARVDDGDKCAQMLLKSGADPNITMENGETPLHVASRHGRLRIIKLILQDGADVSQKSKEGETPLHLACRHGHVRVVKELLQSIQKDRGDGDVITYINSVTNKGESALHYAAKLSNIVQILTPTMSPLTSMTSMTSISMSINSQQNTPAKAAQAQTSKEKPKTVIDAGKEIAQMLLNGGAAVNLQTKDTHETPFHYCAREGNNLILVEMLTRMTPVECQRALNKQSTKGWSPLLTACHKGHVDVVKTLLENNARVDVFDIEGRSGLHLAAEAGYKDICGILLKHKAFINAKSRIGLTALHLAAMKGYTKLCLFLIQEHGAYVDVGTLKKQTPLHMAAAAGQIEVCRLLMGLRANSDATDEQGQKPIHLAAENNHSEVIKLFLKHQNSLVSSSTKDGSTCAHLAAMQGSISVLEELMKFDKTGVISARNRSTDATALQLAAEGGHAELVKSLLEAGASATDENRAGYAAVHLAAKNGHTNVIDALRASKAINLSSRKLGLTALHIAAFYGQQETVRDLLQYISATTPSEPPISVAASFVKELGTESGLTPLHMGAYSGEENVVRLLLNSAGVQVDAPTSNLGFNPLHLACRGGHTTVVGLLLSRSSELLESKDASGKTSLHIAAIHGHKQMCEVLLGQGAEIDAIDKELWTPLHCCAKAGHLEVVRLLTESGASPLAKTSKGHSPIWFAAAENHNIVLAYLMKKEHDTYGLMEDPEFVYNLTICGKNSNNEPLNEFVLASPAPVDVAAKLSNILVMVSSKEKERAKDLMAASKHCEGMAAELLALAAGAESPGKILQSVDRKGTEFLDVLIENEQKEVIAHTVVQRYLQELWVGNLTWANWKLLLLFFTFIFVPPVWIAFSLPLGHKYHKIPIVKFMSYLTSHVHLMILLCLICVTPIYPVLPIRRDLFPFWFEWMFLAWILGLVVSEVANPSDKGGLGWIKVAVIVFSIIAVMVHCVGFFIAKSWYGVLLYVRNQMFGLSVLLAAVQILDFLSFHYLFGPWAIIIGNLMKDLARFLAVLAIFMLGFSFVMSALNHPISERPEGAVFKPTLTNGLPSGVLVTPIDAIELLFFALFGLTNATDMKIEPGQPGWTLILFKIFFGVYMLVTVVVLINLLIAMMSDTYQRIQAQSDIEWKYGLAKLIRNMHRTSATPSPINLFTSWIVWIWKKCSRRKEPINPLKWERKGATPQQQQTGPTKGLFSFGFGKPTAKQRWKNVFKKTQMTPRVSDIMRLSVAQVSPMSQGSPLHGLGSTMSMSAQQRIETVTDWPLIAKKYRALVGSEEPVLPPEPGQEVIIEGSSVNVQNA